MTLGPEHSAFLERLRLQFAARYRDVEVSADGERFALRLSAPGLSTTLPLTPLHAQCLRQPSRAARLILDFVNGSEAQLVRRSPLALRLQRVMWCVRTRAYLAGYSGADELLTRAVAGEMVAFAAEALPNAVMRGVPRSEWAAAGLDDEEVVRSADRTTQARFSRLIARIAAADRVPRDGWKLSGDLVFQSSLLVVPGAMAALSERGGGEVLVAVPERSVVLAQPRTGEAEVVRFRQRVLRTFRESLQPLSREVLVTDGTSVRELAGTSRVRVGLLDRLRG